MSTIATTKRSKVALPTYLPICRVENLYFSYLFMLRAAMKAAPILGATDYDTGNPTEDAHTRDLMHRC